MSGQAAEGDSRAGFGCWTCLDFADLPGIGPCPDCRPDAYAEHVLACVDRLAARRQPWPDLDPDPKATPAGRWPGTGTGGEAA